MNQSNVLHLSALHWLRTCIDVHGCGESKSSTVIVHAFNPSLNAFTKQWRLCYRPSRLAVCELTHRVRVQPFGVQMAHAAALIAHIGDEKLFHFTRDFCAVCCVHHFFVYFVFFYGTACVRHRRRHSARLLVRDFPFSSVNLIFLLLNLSH